MVDNSRRIAGELSKLLSGNGVDTVSVEVRVALHRKEDPRNRFEVYSVELSGIESAGALLGLVGARWLTGRSGTVPPTLRRTVEIREGP